MSNIWKIFLATMTETGGGFRTYTGSLEDGRYFYTATDWECDVLLLDEDPEDHWDENDSPEWQRDHMVGELLGEDALRFWLEMLDCLEFSDPYENREIQRERRVVKAELKR